MMILGEAFFKIFEHVSPDRFEQAIAIHNERGDFFPKPSDIRRVLDQVQARPPAGDPIPKERRLPERPASKEWLRDHLHRFRLKSLPNARPNGMSEAEFRERKEALRKQARAIQDGGLSYGD
jgi:hypothetical protein